MANEYLKRTPTSPGNRQVWTFSCWEKRNKLGSGSIFYTSQTSSPYLSCGVHNADDTFEAVRSENGTVTELHTEAIFRDVGSWIHYLIVFDTTQSVESNRTKLYVNGSLSPFDSSANYATLNYLGAINKQHEHNIGGIINTGGSLVATLSSELADLFLVDGQALTPDVFGFYKDGKGYQSSGTTQATDFRPGQWSPHSPRKIKTEIERRGGFGVNGFYLPMNDSSNVGADFHTTPNSIITLKGEDLPQPRNGAPTTSDAYVSQLRQETGTLGFDGVVAFRDDGDYLQQPDSSDFTVGTNDYTIEFFANFSSDDGVYRVCGQRNSSAAESQFLAEYVNGVFYYYHSIGGSTHSVQARTHTSQWYHIAIVRQSQVLKLYIDGVLRDTNTTTGSLDDRAQPFSIGRQGNYTPQSFRGFLSNFRFVNGSAVYTTNNFTPPTEPLTAITNTKLLCCNSSTSATAATITPGTITAYNNVFATRNELTGSIILACPFVAGGFGQNGAANSTIPGLGDYHIALGGPSSVSAVNFLAGSGTQAEISGSNGLYYGSSLDVTSSSIRPRATVGTSFKLDGDYTIEFWAYINSFNSGGSHLVQYDSDSGQTGWAFSADNGTARFFLRNSNGSDYNIAVSGVIPAGQWNHFAGVYESSKDKTTLYVNGVAVGVNLSVPSNYTSSLQYSALNRLHIGCNVGNGSRPMQGYMQDLRVYKGVAKYKGGFDVSRPYTPVGIEDSRTVSDTCKNNFATLNSLDYNSSATALSDGNLTMNATSNNGSAYSATYNVPNSGKYYFEFYEKVIDVTTTNYISIVSVKDDTKYQQYRGYGYIYTDGVQATGYATMAEGDLVGVGIDADNGTVSFYKNGTLVATVTSSSVDHVRGAKIRSYLPRGAGSYPPGDTRVYNFGQNLTFSDILGNKGNRLNSANNSWTLTHGGSQGNFTVADDGVTLSGTTASSAYMRATYTLDPKKKYIISFKYTAGANNTLALQDDKGYITTTDGTSTTALQVGNHYAAVISASTSVVITATNWSTSYTINNIHLSEYDAGYTDDSGKGKFQYQPPTGYLALCEDNLPTPTIADPGKHFKTVLYTGTGSSRAVRGVGFKPDFIWCKSRTNTEGHIIFDSVRGAEQRLLAMGTQTEATSAGGVMSFDDDGFSTAQYTGTNQSGQNYVAWCWKAGGEAVTNNDGSITSLVSANQTAGFSIVSYTGTGSAGTVGHGLGKAPSLIITKHRAGTSAGNVNWNVSTSVVPGGYLELNTTVAHNSNADRYITAGTNTNSFPSGYVQFNDSNRTYISYCWAEIEGFSKFGSYDGNGVIDGPFVYCGFKPAWIMIKPYGSGNGCYSSGYSSWSIYDSSRSPVNDSSMHERVLFANRDYAEGKRGNGASSGAFQNLDFVSNGFKIRGNSNCETNTTSINGFMFAAFAESPFQTANAK